MWDQLNGAILPSCFGSKQIPSVEKAGAWLYMGSKCCRALCYVKSKLVLRYEGKYEYVITKCLGAGNNPDVSCRRVELPCSSVEREQQTFSASTQTPRPLRGPESSEIRKPHC
jgi:hypothetical protein